MSVYLADNINPKAVENFLTNCKNSNISIRALQIVKGGVPLVRVSLPPYDFDQPCYLYSLSKSFTSIACGICFDMGLLSAETKMCELFADKMPETISEELSQMTLGDLLSMQSGHADCVMSAIRTTQDTIKAFFEQPIAVKTGTAFCYDTAATCICAASVEKVTGMKITDFLYEKMFSVMEIEKPRWDECKDGQTLGGTGLYLSSDSIVKFGTMLINKGVYKGKRIVSEKYIEEATSLKSLQNPDPSIIEWTRGYGYQFWLNGKGGFRGDGAFGQFCFVFPEKDMIVVFSGECIDTIKEMDYMYKMLDDLYGEGDIEGLMNISKSFYAPKPVKDGFNKDISFKVDENPSGISKMRFFGESLLHLEMETDYGKKEIVFGNGDYIHNAVLLKNLCVGLDPRDERRDTLERLEFFTCYEIENENLLLTLRHKDRPHNQCWYVNLKEGTVEIKIVGGTIVTSNFKLSPLESVE